MPDSSELLLVVAGLSFGLTAAGVLALWGWELGRRWWRRRILEADRRRTWRGRL